MKTENTKEMVEHMLKELQRPVKTLTGWELNFLESVSDQFSERGRLTDNQFSKLEAIYAAKTA